MVEEEEKKKKNRARKLYVTIALGSVFIAVGVYSFLYTYPLVWQRDFPDDNGIPKLGDVIEVSILSETPIQ